MRKSVEDDENRVEAVPVMQSEDTPAAPKPQSGPGAAAEAREAARRKRLAQALRDNLKRRKAPRPGEPPAGDDQG